MLENYLKECLYFTASRLTRLVTKMAEEEFAPSGISPTFAYALLAIYEKEGISQKELGELLHLQPSTVSRFIEKLMIRGLIYNEMDGRISRIYTTERGKNLQSTIQECWMSLRKRYADILGEKESDDLTLHLYEVSEKLE